jgi:hypothetical protein
VGIFVIPSQAQTVDLLLRDVIGRFLLSSFECPSVDLEPLPRYVEYMYLCVCVSIKGERQEEAARVT